MFCSILIQVPVFLKGKFANKTKVCTSILHAPYSKLFPHPSKIMASKKHLHPSRNLLKALHLVADNRISPMWRPRRYSSPAFMMAHPSILCQAGNNKGLIMKAPWTFLSSINRIPFFTGLRAGLLRPVFCKSGFGRVKYAGADGTRGDCGAFKTISSNWSAVQLSWSTAVCPQHPSTKCGATLEHCILSRAESEGEGQRGWKKGRERSLQAGESLCALIWRRMSRPFYRRENKAYALYVVLQEIPASLQPSANRLSIPQRN